jgi:hypothetical protein
MLALVEGPNKGTSTVLWLVQQTSSRLIADMIQLLLSILSRLLHPFISFFI